MLRISSFLFLLLTVALSLAVAQNGKDVVGAHIEWEGVLEPRINVVETTRTIEINIVNDRECVTVYSPATVYDYTIVVSTPNGTVTAAKPHPSGFQARFCYNIVGPEQILYVHLQQGSLSFAAIDGTSRTMQAEQVVNFILPRSGRGMRYEAGGVVGAHGSEQAQGTVTGVVEKGPRFATVIPQTGQAAVVPAPKTAEIKAEATVGAKVEVPVVVPHTGTTQLAPVQMDAQSQASEEEIARFYGEAPRPVEEEGFEWDSWYASLQIDHSTDDKLLLGFWVGVQSTRQSGSVRFDSQTNGARGTPMRMSHLDLDDTSWDPAFGITVDYSGFRFGFDISYAEFDGTSTAPAAGYRIGDIVMASGSTLRADMENYWYRFTFGYTTWLNENVGIGFDMQFELWTWEGDFHAVESGSRDEAKIWTVIPGGGIYVEWTPRDRWLITWGLHGTWFTSHDIQRAWFVNSDIWFRFFTCEYSYIFLRAEYEWAEYYLDDVKDVDLDQEFRGVWNIAAGIGLRF